MRQWIIMCDVIYYVKNPKNNFDEKVNFEGRNLSEIFFRVYTPNLIFDPLSDGIGHFSLQ